MSAQFAFTPAALANIQETGCDPNADVAALRSGQYSIASLLTHCLDGADADREQGWRDYVSALADALDFVTVETMPDWCRASCRAARNWGQYPLNGAERSVVPREDAEEIIESDPDGYAHIVEVTS